MKQDNDEKRACTAMQSMMGGNSFGGGVLGVRGDGDARVLPSLYLRRGVHCVCLCARQKYHIISSSDDHTSLGESRH
jgi:hypothetical protein